MINIASSPRVTGRSILARCLVGAAALGLGGTAVAGDQLAGALFGAGAGAIIGHSVAGPDAAILGGVIGAVTGAALTAGPAGAVVHYRQGYRYAPPAYYPEPPPVYYSAPPPVYYVPSHGPGFWRHGVDSWGRPLRTWVPAPRHRGFHAPPPHWRADRHGPRGHGNSWDRHDRRGR